MRLSSSGIITNEYNHVLLIQRDDTRTWCQPGGSLEMGTLPNDNATKEVREETGLYVLPVRLVGLEFWPIAPEGAMGFVFRCLMRGGTLTPSAESPQVAFFPSTKLPRAMVGFHRRIVMDALHHAEDAPHMHVHKPTVGTIAAQAAVRGIIYPIKNLIRRWQGNPYVPAPTWQVDVVLVVRDGHGRIWWQNRADGWELPTVRHSRNQPPWETAAQLAQEQLGQPATARTLLVVAVPEKNNHMTLVFEMNTAAPTADGPHWHATPPAHTAPHHATWATADPTQTTFLTINNGQ